MKHPKTFLGYVFAAFCLTSASAVAQESGRLGLWGTPGLIDMPTAEVMPDGELSSTVSSFGNITRLTLNFQATPRFSGTFRYNEIQEWNSRSFDTFYDRNFDFKYQLVREGKYLPAVAVGMRDVGGTGLNSAEYLAATKTLFPGFKATVGLGWGRLGSANQISSGFGERPEIDFGRGGNFNTNQWFRGDIGFFGGVSWQVNDRLALLAEYSSDDYDLEAVRRGVFERKSDFNFGARYKLRRGATLGVYSMYGSEIGLSLAFALNPNNPVNKGTIERAPYPVNVRAPRADNPDVWSEDWATVPTLLAQVANTSVPFFKIEGIELEGMTLSGSSVTVRIDNRRYNSEAQAAVRVARFLTRTMPASVETFRIVLVSKGIAMSALTFRRSDLEALEHHPDASAALLAVTGITDAPLEASTIEFQGTYPKFTWAIGPYIRSSYFDPAEPLRFEIGLRAQGRYHFKPGLSVAAKIAQQIGGTLSESDQESNSVLPKVRTDGALYNRTATGVVLEQLTLDYYTRPGRNLYFHGQAGYLERMFAGVSAELLWKPVDSRLGLGAEINYVRQRDFEIGFGLRDYSVTTGHLSAYYDLTDDLLVQVDAGKYLAGDYGATVSVKREFNNGWRIGAFATKTNVSADEFGEGSFDKGLTIEAPLTYFLGTQNIRSVSTTIRPIQRDGGARVNISGRLYDEVRNTHRNRLTDQWGRVWK